MKKYNTDRILNYILINKNSNIDIFHGYLILCIIIAFSGAIFLFPEKFHFWEYAFSWLGYTVTINGLPNFKSMLFYDIGMIGCIIISIITRYYLKAEMNGKYKSVKVILFTLIPIGFLLNMCPSDINDRVHQTGASIIFACFWLYANLLSVEIKQTSILKFLFIQILLQSTVLPYAYLFFIDSDFQNYTQKTALAGVIFTVKLESWIVSRM